MEGEGIHDTNWSVEKVLPILCLKTHRMCCLIVNELE